MVNITGRKAGICGQDIGQTGAKVAVWENIFAQGACANTGTGRYVEHCNAQGIGINTTVGARNLVEQKAIFPLTWHTDWIAIQDAVVV